MVLEDADLRCAEAAAATDAASALELLLNWSGAPAGLEGLGTDAERTTRAYLSLVRLHRGLHRCRRKRAAAAPEPEPEPEPQPQPADDGAPSIELASAGAETEHLPAGRGGGAGAFQSVQLLASLLDSGRGEQDERDRPRRHLAKVAPQPELGIPPVVGGALAASHGVPRLKLSESLLGHDATTAHSSRRPTTRSSRRLSSQRGTPSNTERSLRGTPSNTDRSLRSVRLHLQDDTAALPDARHLSEGSGSGLGEEQYALSASRQLQLLAARSAGVFVARRTAGIVTNLRDQGTAAQHHDRPAAQRAAQHAITPAGTPDAHLRHFVVELMDKVVTGALENSSTTCCVLDADVLLLPVNVLLAEVMSIEEAGLSSDYRTAVLKLCCSIASAVDTWKLLNTAGGRAPSNHGSSAQGKARPSPDEVVAVLPGGTSASPRRPALPVAVTASPAAGRDRVLLRLASRSLKGLVQADTLDHARLSRCLSLIAEYVKLVPSRREQALELMADSLRQLPGRICTGSGFSVRVHCKSIEVVHGLLALFEATQTEWLVAQPHVVRWIGTYCCWTLTTDASESPALTAEQIQSQVPRFIVQSARIRKQDTDVSALFRVAVSHDHATASTTGLARATAALDLISEMGAGTAFQGLLQECSNAAMHCASTVFLRVYFHLEQSTETQALCCKALKVMLRLLEVNSEQVVEQVHQLSIVETLLGELSGEHDSRQKSSAPKFAAVASSTEFVQDHRDMPIEEDIDDTYDEHISDDDDDVYGRSAQSDSLDSRYTGQDDSYSASEEFFAPPVPKVAMPPLTLSGFSLATAPKEEASQGSNSGDISGLTLKAPALNLGAMDLGAMQPVSQPEEMAADAPVEPVMNLDSRPLYQNEELHLLILQCIMALLMTPGGSLSPTYWSRTPAAEGKPNLHNLLYDHLNHERNRHLVPELANRVLEASFAEGGTCLLKLLCEEMFNSSEYAGRTRLAVGASGTVYKCTIPAPEGPSSPTLLGRMPQVVALKVIDRSSSANHFCPLPDVFSETRVLSRLRGCEGACQLIDYGVGPESYYIALRCYTTSLRKWRLHQDTLPARDNQQLLYLRIYRRILDVVERLSACNIIHYDIKCDNVLMSPIDNVELTDFWAPTTTATSNPSLKYEVVLADFGVGKIVDDNEGMHTIRNRGTECIKSPEMILADSTSNKAHPSYDRRRTDGSTSSSDVWSLGCLLYERESEDRRNERLPLSNLGHL